MNLSEAQIQFEDLISKISTNDFAKFFKWVQNKYLVSECLGDRPAIAYSTLRRIANDIKLLIPSNGILSTETIDYPSTGENSDCRPDNTVPVDAFLYDDIDIDDLVNDGKLSRNYCLDCNSRNIEPLNFISHSASRRRISFIFSGFLKGIDFSNKTILDVSSRLGALLYGAYLYTNAKLIIGVEINKELCDLQNTIINQNQMSDRINVICSDICDVPDIVSSADIILLNNVFEFFQSRTKQVNCWEFLRKNIKCGAILVTVPSLEDSIKTLPQSTIILSEWVCRQDVRDPLLAMTMEDEEELSEICVYKVL